MTTSEFSPWYAEWQQSAEKQLARELLVSSKQQALLHFVCEHSAYLRSLLFKHPDIFLANAEHGADESWKRIAELLTAPFTDFSSAAQLAAHLRFIKQRAALLIALADIDASWNLKQVTAALSELAEQSIDLALAFLLTQAANKGEIELSNAQQPSLQCGIIILGMGKLGAYELNYSSDIDLIIFYEREALKYHGRHNEQHFANKLAQELVKLMQERTADGYVFRTDLRLRPDPASMPLAVSTEAAMQYYENLGQNWERAAMIKARPVAGDLDASERLLKQLGAYVWRKNLDFASIQDILSIKRQIGKKVGIKKELLGHNIKLGKGGIREIEFFVQLHQLIWGGRQTDLRGRETIDTIHSLTQRGHINSEQAQQLITAYEFYRMLEHRLQMVEDQQTHCLPEDEAAFESIAHFMKFDSVEAFATELQMHISTIHRIFAESFDSDDLSAAEGNLVFTGTSHDPDTLDTLSNMGFVNTTAISQTVMDWHRGSRRCTRSKVARQLLTELVPDILQALANTVSPDDAFFKFDQFLRELPVGLQLFSLISNNPQVLQLIADIMGTAPTLSQTLSRRPQLIETTLFKGFYTALPGKQSILDELNAELKTIEYYDSAMERLRQFKNEKHFQAGVQLLRSITTTKAIGQYLSDLADVLIDSALRLTLDEFSQQYGRLQQGRCCIIALGKLGSGELTFGSDVDLMFVYDAVESGDDLSIEASTYFNRLAQRMVSALTAIGTNGALYEVDTRLRPSGQQGLLAVSKQALTQYFSSAAWTYERMALCKARAIAGDEGLQHEVEEQIHAILNHPRDLLTLKSDVVTMRRRVEEAYGTDDIWKIKHVAGGLMDIDFVAQYLVLGGAHQFPELNMRRSRDILKVAINNPAILAYFHMDAKDIACLIEASRFLIRLQHMLRLTSENKHILSTPPTGLADVLTHHMKLADYQTLKESLMSIEKNCRQAYISAMLETT